MSKNTIFLLFILALVVACGYYFFVYELPYQGRVSVSPTIDIIGYRGYGDDRPENSMAAIQFANQTQLDGVHLTVQPTLDDDLVVFSDTRLERLTTITGYTDEEALFDLQRTRIIDEVTGEETDQLIVPLDDVVELLDEDITLYLEVRNNEVGDTGVERLVVNYIEDNNLYDRAFIASFNPMMIWRAGNRDPNVRTLWLTSNVNIASDAPTAANAVQLPWVAKQEWFRRGLRKLLRPDLVGVHASVTPDDITTLKEFEYPIVFWRADAEADLTSAKVFKPQAVITSQPALARQLFSDQDE